MDDGLMKRSESNVVVDDGDDDDDYDVGVATGV